MTFLRTWQEYLASRSDSPPAFAIPSGLTVLAVALGNRSYISGWSKPIWPNLWTVLIAPSGFGKSLPLDVGGEVLERAGLEKLIMPDTFSTESLIYRLTENPIGIFIAQEFSSFVDTLSASYNAGSEKWLTNLYDGGDMAGKRSVRDREQPSGYREIFIRRPAISMLGASSPEWFARAFTEANLRGGFFGRMVFIPTMKAGNPVDFPGPHDEHTLNILARHLTEWDRRQRQELRDETDPEFSGVKSRAGALCLKTMMLFHVSRDPSNKILDPEDFDLARRFVEASMKRAMSYLAAQVPRNKPEATRLKILEILEREPRKRHAEMLSELHITSYELKGHIETLVEAEKVKMDRDPDMGLYYVRARNGNGNAPPPPEIPLRPGSGNGHSPTGGASWPPRDGKPPGS